MEVESGLVLIYIFTFMCPIKLRKSIIVALHVKYALDPAYVYNVHHMFPHLREDNCVGN